MEDIRSWLTFHEVDAPFTSMGYVINRDNVSNLSFVPFIFIFFVMCAVYSYMLHILIIYSHRVTVYAWNISMVIII